MTTITKTQRDANDVDITAEKPVSQANEKIGAENVEQDAENMQEVPNHSTFKVIVISIALMMATFLVALDTNILATAIPQITSEFSSLDHVSWYGAAYSLCKMVFQPSFGRLCSLFPLKIVFHFSNALLIIGSIICATAPTSEVLILGRAVQGWGGAGIFSSTITMYGFVVSKKHMPLFISVLGSVYIVASILGPVIGGVFADSYLTWRFCFWINLPLSVLSIGLMHFTMPEPKREIASESLGKKLVKLDPIGTGVLIVSVTTLILALQWGGVSAPWKDGKVWGCLLCFGVTLIGFIVYQIKRKEDALIPMRIITQRTVASSCAVMTLLIMGINVPVYYLPFYFQVSLGVSTAKSGLYILPLAALNPAASIVSGFMVTKTGAYVPWMIASGALAAIGYGIISTLNMESNLGHILGFQALASIGFGLGVQLPMTALRNVLNDTDIAIGNSLLIFFQGLGTSLSLSIGQNIFLNTLKKRLSAELSPAEANAISDMGAGDVNSDHINQDKLPIVARAYNFSMKTTMYFAIATAVAAFLCACAVEWKKVDLGKNQKKDEEANEPTATSEGKEQKLKTKAVKSAEK